MDASLQPAMNEPRMPAGHPADELPLIAHVIHRLDFGGLENGLANLLHRLPRDRFRHAVITLTDYTAFRERLPAEVPVIALHRKSGQDFGLYRKLWTTFRTLQPSIVHTRNLATLEAQLPAWLAGVPARVHGEHGRDVHDLDNTRRRYVWLRRAIRPFVHRYTAVSRELTGYLENEVGVRPERVRRICNGVDTQRFAPRTDQPLMTEAPQLRDRLLLGSVGRMQGVKDPLNLVNAFLHLLTLRPELKDRIALVMVGDGPLRQEALARLTAAGVADQCWLPGSRQDTPEILASLAVFALPSLAEGISNTILEAMASGCPVVATDVGGNSELVSAGNTGALVPRADPEALAAALLPYLLEPELRAAHGAAGRARAVSEFSLDHMVAQYAEVYSGLLAARAERKRIS
jgi:sugar transferase (PEP-CTERM/EpsH1 system associated)